jgi:hypothetical protein
MPLEAFIAIAIILAMIPATLADRRDNNRKK